MGDVAPTSDAVCDGGDLDCGSGLLLIIRNAMAPLAPGGVLEVRSRESSVREDLPAWCRMVGHSLFETAAGEGSSTSYFIRKKHEDALLATDLEQARRYTWRTRVRLREGMVADAFVRNHSFPVGQPASFDTEDKAPSAIEYLLSSLAGCLAVGFAWRASQRGIGIRHLEVSLKAQSGNILVFLGVDSEGDPGIDAVEGRLFVDCDAEDDALLGALWDETVMRSPVARSLVRAVPVRVEMRRA